MTCVNCGGQSTVTKVPRMPNRWWCSFCGGWANIKKLNW